MEHCDTHNTELVLIILSTPGNILHPNKSAIYNVFYYYSVSYQVIYFYSTDAQLDYSKRMSKFILNLH